MPKIVAEIPEDTYKSIKDDIRLGIFSDTSEAISSAIRKSYAKKSRAYLRWLMKKEGITEAAMLKELKKLRQ